MNHNTLRKIFLTLTALIVGTSISLAEDDMPIIAYIGVPNTQSTEQNFKDFSECGFNVSLHGYANLEEMTKACDIAHRYGVKILGHCPETHQQPEKAAAVMKNHPGFYGYILQDEPSAPEIKELKKEIVRLKRTDSKRCFYINLLPYYEDWVLQHTKTKSYDEYLNTALTAETQQLSFDFYPITKDGIRNGWYSNLETVRSKCAQKGIPFWGFVLSVPHALYPQPTMGSLRLQVYTNLAYGAQAIQYFTYWTPQPEGENDYHDGPIDRNGKKTKTYFLVQQMNRELKEVARLFYGAKVLSVHHLGTIPEGTTRLNQTPVNLRSLKVVGRQGAIVSQIEKNDHRYLAIVNKSHEQPLTIRIQTRNSIPRQVTKQLKEKAMKDSYRVSAGDILLFKLK